MDGKDAETNEFKWTSLRHCYVLKKNKAHAHENRGTCALLSVTRERGFF